MSEFTATQAQKTAKSWLDKANKDHKREYNKLKEKERAATAAMWPTRGLMWVEKIEGYIKKAAAKGNHHTYEPTSTNPNGDLIIYIGAGDKPIYEKLMQHFRDKGFTVEEYQHGGMEITW